MFFHLDGWETFVNMQCSGNPWHQIADCAGCAGCAGWRWVGAPGALGALWVRCGCAGCMRGVRRVRRVRRLPVRQMRRVRRVQRARRVRQVRQVRRVRWVRWVRKVRRVRWVRRVQRARWVHSIGWVRGKMYKCRCKRTFRNVAWSMRSNAKEIWTAWSKASTLCGRRCRWRVTSSMRATWTASRTRLGPKEALMRYKYYSESPQLESRGIFCGSSHHHNSQILSPTSSKIPPGWLAAPDSVVLETLMFCKRSMSNSWNSNPGKSSHPFATCKSEDWDWNGAYLPTKNWEPQSQLILWVHDPLLDLAILCLPLCPTQGLIQSKILSGNPWECLNI